MSSELDPDTLKLHTHPNNHSSSHTHSSRNGDLNPALLPPRLLHMASLETSPQGSKASENAKKFRTQYASLLAATGATLTTSPLENIKVRMQSAEFRNATACASFIYKHEGIRGFWAGVIPPLISIGTVRLISMTIYQEAKYSLSDTVERVTGQSPLTVVNTPGTWPNATTFTTFAAAGAVSGFMSAFVACPFELARNVSMTSTLVERHVKGTAVENRHLNGKPPPRMATSATLKEIVRQHGYGGLYSGLRLHLVRDTIGTAIYFGVYESAKHGLTAFWEMKSAVEGVPVSIAGCLSGMISWSVTYALDTTKTRTQSKLLGKTKAAEVARIGAKSSYKGLGVSLARTGVQNAVFFYIFEKAKKYINQMH
ncbi:MAG: hypothetical protein M1834_004472 [Cirrosporium novae-zelandiae]|nr:MAG: hypothetical protein M1834_004472 [Cirrosporium novae-zelandiae]